MGIFDWLTKNKSDRQRWHSPEEIKSSYGDQSHFYYDQGIALYELGRYTDAERSYRNAIQLNPRFAWAFCNLAVLLDEMGRHAEALDAIKSAISLDPNDSDFRERQKEIMANIKGKQPQARPDSATARWQATEHFKAGRYSDALASIDKAIAADKHAHGAESPEVAFGLKNRGMALLSRGDHREAIADYEKALAIFEKLGARSTDQVAICLNDIGCAYLAVGDISKATGYLEQAVTIERHLYDDGHPDLGRHLVNLGNAYLTGGNTNSGRKAIEEGYGVLCKMLGPTHPDCIQVKKAMRSM